MKRLFSLLVLIPAVAFFSYTASAQEYEDVICKLNGSFVRGTMIGPDAEKSKITGKTAAPDTLPGVSVPPARLRSRTWSIGFGM